MGFSNIAMKGVLTLGGSQDVQLLKCFNCMIFNMFHVSRIVWVVARVFLCGLLDILIGLMHCYVVIMGFLLGDCQGVNPLRLKLNFSNRKNLIFGENYHMG